MSPENSLLTLFTFCQICVFFPGIFCGHPTVFVSERQYSKLVKCVENNPIAGGHGN